MDTHIILTAIQNAVPNADISLEGEGCQFTAVVASPSFEGLSQVRRQQQILAGLKPWLETGELHAVTLRTYTPQELEQARSAGSAGWVTLS